jgi:hypothetical protein
MPRRLAAPLRGRAGPRFDSSERGPSRFWSFMGSSRSARARRLRTAAFPRIFAAIYTRVPAPIEAAPAPVAWRVRGWPARILQHEVDHVDGTLYVDRMMPRSFSTQDQARARYAGKPIAEIRRLLGL